MSTHGLLLSRYYEKSIIEQEIDEQRKGNNFMHWAETKRNIREARYRLSLRTESLASHNGHTPKNGNSTTTSMTFLPKEEISMHMMSP